LDENLKPAGHFTFDEVRHTDRLRGQSVDLKRKTAEVSSGRALSIEEAARKDSAVHVSLSSDSPVKQPGDLAAPTLGNARGPSKLEDIRRNRTPVHRYQ
jgi:hypothetical protein